MAIIKIVIQRRTQTFMVLRKELLREFIKENDLTTAKEIQNALKEVFASILQEIDMEILNRRLLKSIKLMYQA